MALDKQFIPQSHPKPAWLLRKGSHGSLDQARKTRKRICSTTANGEAQTLQIQVLLLQPFSPSCEKRALPTGNSTFCCRKGSHGRVQASAGMQRGTSREEPGDTESLAQRWQNLPKFHPRSPGTSCRQHTDGDRFERGKAQGLSSHLHRGQTRREGRAPALPGSVLDRELLKQGWSRALDPSIFTYPGKAEVKSSTGHHGGQGRSSASADPELSPAAASQVISKINPELRK